jgi:hypothetical protein
LCGLCVVIVGGLFSLAFQQEPGMAQGWRNTWWPAVVLARRVAVDTATGNHLAGGA